MKQFLSKPLYLISAGIIVIVIILGVTLSVKNANDQASVKKADEIAATYQPDITDYSKLANEEIKTQIAKVNSEQTAKEFANVVTAKIKAIPALGSVDVYGAEHSEAYKKAAASKDQLTALYQDLAKYAGGELAITYAFADSVQGLLNMKVNDYIGGGAVMDGSPVREKLIPAYQAALDKFKNVQVPKGQEELAKNTTTTYTNFIVAANDAAKKLDAHESFSFDFSEQFATLQNQLNTLKTTTQANFMTAVQKATK